MLIRGINITTDTGFSYNIYNQRYACMGGGAAALFDTAPEPAWGPSYGGILVDTGAGGGLTLDGFLALWAYMASMHPRTVVAYAM